MHSFRDGSQSYLGFVVVKILIIRYAFTCFYIIARRRITNFNSCLNCTLLISFYSAPIFPFPIFSVPKASHPRVRQIPDSVTRREDAVENWCGCRPVMLHTQLLLVRVNRLVADRSWVSPTSHRGSTSRGRGDTSLGMCWYDIDATHCRYCSFHVIMLLFLLGGVELRAKFTL